LIKISDGMIMSFQGDTLWHGTTIRQDSITGKVCPPGNIYGIHFGLSVPTLTSFCCIRIAQYIREMNQIPKMVICNMEDNTEDEDDMMKQGITSNKKNLIKYASQKRTANDDIVKNISSTIMIDDQFETTAEMEHEYYSVISSELQKETPILVDKDKNPKCCNSLVLQNMNNSFQIGQFYS